MQEQLLASGDVPRREDDMAAGIQRPSRHRGLRLVGAVGEQPEDEEPEQDDEEHRLEPAPGDEQLASR
jgi:hypothetical protein